MKIYIISSFPDKVCGIAKYTSNFLKKLKNNNIRYISRQIFFQKNIFDAFKLFNYYFEILTKNYRIIHIQYTPTIVGPFFPLFLFFLLNRKTIITSHETPHFYLKKTKYLIFPFFWLYEYLIYNFSSKIIVHTKAHREILLNWYFVNKRKVKIISHPIFDKPDCKLNEKEIYNKYNFSKEKIYITVFGRVTRKKGLDLILKQFNNLEKKYELLVIGKFVEEDYKREINQMMKKFNLNNRIHLLGFMSDEDMNELFRISSLFLLYYRSVTQSGALFTVLSYGKPVLLSDLEGFREVLNLYHVGEIIQSIKILPKKVKKIVTNQRRYEKELNKIKNELSEDAITDKIIRLYKGEKVYKSVNNNVSMGFLNFFKKKKVKKKVKLSEEEKVKERLEELGYLE